MTEALKTEDLKKYFKSNFQVRTIKALDGISLEVKEGEVYGCVGQNGAGKTTLIKILTGLIRPSDGKAELMGRPLGDTKALAEIGLLPERPYFYEHLTAREALRFYGRLNDMAKDKIDARSDELLEMLNLAGSADRPMRSYSKGMLQRLGMAQAVLHDPRLLILDEPMSGLDPVGRGRIKETIRLLKAQGKTIFFSTHILSDVEELCDRMALIVNGRLWYSGTVDGLTSRYEQGVDFSFQDLDGDQRNFIRNLPGEDFDKGRGTTLFLSKDKDPKAILQTLVERKIPIVKMAPRRMTLEEIFLSEGMKDKEEAQ